jgi:hypothetical protein
MSSVIGSATGTLVATYLPFDHATNIALGMASGQLVTAVMDKFGNIGGYVYSLFSGSKHTVKVYPTEHGRTNPIYKKLEQYILNGYLEQLSQCNLGKKTPFLPPVCGRK